MSQEFRVAVNKTVQVSCTREKALSYLAHLPNLGHYEPKVDSLRVHPMTSDREGTYHAAGRFAGVLPWSGTFSYRLQPDGFDSELIDTARILGFLKSPVKVRGGFKVLKAQSDDACEILHWEEYTLPAAQRLIAPLFRRYLESALATELETIARALK